MGCAKVSEKGSDGLDANQVVFYPIVLVGRVKCIGIQTKAEEDWVRTQFLLEEGHDGNGAPLTGWDGSFAEGFLHGRFCCLVAQGRIRHHGRGAAVMGFYLDGYRCWGNGFEMVFK